MPIIDQTYDGDQAAVTFIEGEGCRVDWHRLDEGWLELRAGLNPQSLEVNAICLSINEWSEDTYGDQADAHIIDNAVADMSDGYAIRRNEHTENELADRIEKTYRKCAACPHAENCAGHDREKCAKD